MLRNRWYQTTSSLWKSLGGTGRMEVWFRLKRTRETCMCKWDSSSTWPPGLYISCVHGVNCKMRHRSWCYSFCLVLFCLRVRQWALGCSRLGWYDSPDHLCHACILFPKLQSLLTLPSLKSYEDLCHSGCYFYYHHYLWRNHTW